MNEAMIHPPPSGPDRIDPEPVSSWLWPVMVILGTTAIVAVFMVAPVLAGPPSRNEPLQALAWLPLGTLALWVGGGLALLVTLIVGASLRDVLLKRHAIRPFIEPSMAGPFLLLLVGVSLIPGIALARTLGWDHPAAVLGCGLLTLGAGVAVHEALILIGWLHEDTEGCCQRSSADRLERLNRIETRISPEAPAPGRTAVAFGGSEQQKLELLAALAEQRRRGAIVREQPEAICDFRIRLGCPVPCQRTHTATDGDPDEDLGDHHRYMRTLHGVPAPLSALENAMFSNLPAALTTEWPQRFVGAIPAGADLGLAADRWLLWLLTEADSPLSPVHERLEAPAELLRRRIAGDEPSAGEWDDMLSALAEPSSAGCAPTITRAIARAGVSGSELDAAGEVAAVAVCAGRAGEDWQAHAIVASRREARERAVREARGVIRRPLARIRWLIGAMRSEATGLPYEQARAQVWERMADQLLEVTAAS